MKNVEKLLGLAMLVFAIGFNLWLYRLEPSATTDPNDNAFQFALVDRTNQVWDFAGKKCSSTFRHWDLRFGICQISYLADHWVPNWAEGYNLPFYYSHIPQIVIVGSYRLFGALSNFIRPPLASMQEVVLQKASEQSISIFQYYHWVIYLLLSFFPLSVFLALRVIKLPWLIAGIGALLASHISTDGLYGLDPPSFLWRGYGLSSQLFGMIWMLMAIAYSYLSFAQSTKFEARSTKQIQNSNVQNSKRLGFRILDLGFVTRLARDGEWNRTISDFGFRISDFWMAVFFLVATAMGHLGLGIMAMLSLVPLALAKPILMILQWERFSDIYEVIKNQLTKLLMISAAVIFFLSYWIVPIFLADNYHNISFWDPPWKFASYGAKETITRLLNGDLFDWGRWPWMTGLVIVGLIASLWPNKSEAPLGKTRGRLRTKFETHDDSGRAYRLACQNDVMLGSEATPASVS
ncbi:hypothetical protein HY949_03735, partial [Candidatus Gottesmanbacteria bacterium]|nr:hypothetical protein [Candidatus Gottesmanbacteria bacterium]